MRRAARVDANQAELVVALRKMGASVQHLSQLGQGTPDLLIGFNGYNLLLELKDCDKPPSQRKLTEDQQAWHRAWRGRVSVVSSLQEALQAIAEIESEGGKTSG